MTELFACNNDSDRGVHQLPLKQTSKLARSAFQTLPILLAGSMAMSLNLTETLQPANATGVDKAKDSNTQPRKAVTTAIKLPASQSTSTGPASSGSISDITVASTVPATYRVVNGDTISGIAAQFGLGTASVLALNGLGWKSLIFPGQLLRLAKTLTPSQPTPPKTTTPQHATPTTHTVATGDTISGIAAHYGVSTQSVLTANKLGWSSIIHPGQKITIPAHTAPAPAPAPAPKVDPDPVVDVTPTHDAPTTHTVATGDTISGIAAHYGVSTQSVLTANKLGWSSIIHPGQKIAIPAHTAPAPAPAPAPKVDPDPVVDVTPTHDAPATPSTRYIIKSGDTVSGIAAHYGVSTQSVLTANKLGWSSIIYTGQTLAIPGGGSTPASVGKYTTPLTAEMTTNARTIISVGKSLGVTDYGLIIALASAMQESGLRNLNYGDRDSLGLFQQRPSTGWGTPAQVTDPTYASRLFFGGPSNPNKAKTRGLMDIAGWQSMSVTQAAQAVQHSAYPNAYAKWESSARTWLAQLR